MKQQAQGFMDFIREQGVVGLAVGLVLGSAVKTVVDSLVNNIVNPLLGLVLGNGESLTSLSLHIGRSEVKYGEFLNALIQLLVIAAVIYFVVRGLKLDRLDRKKDEASREAKSPDTKGPKPVEKAKST